jgi:hypothetical protein
MSEEDIGTTPSLNDGNVERRRRIGSTDILLGVCAAAGVGVAVLSFMTWMDITFTEVIGGQAHIVVLHEKGTDSDALTTFGDGYLTAALGMLAIGLALACRWVGQMAFYVAAGLVVAGACIAGTGLYTLAYDRTSSGNALGLSVSVEVSREPALWGLTALAILMTGAAILIAWMFWRANDEAQAEPEVEDELS